MKPQWESQLTQFSAFVESWREIFPRLPPTFTTAQGMSIPTEEVTRSLELMLESLRLLNENSYVDGILLAIHQPGVLNPIQQIASAISALGSNPAAPQFIDQIAQNLWAIRASLSWIIPSAPSADGLVRLRDFDLEAKLNTLERLSSDYSRSIASTALQISDLQSYKAAAEATLALLNTYEKESTNAKVSAEASAQTAATSKQMLVDQLAELNTGIDVHSKLLLQISDLKEKVESTLVGASKVALAASFSERKQQLTIEKKKWDDAFRFGIVVLIILGGVVAFGFFGKLPSILKTDGGVDFGALIARLVLMGPPVWFTWFAAKQYSHSLRLIEDYAFKEASALAFIGYKREMGDDEDMIKLLRESAIKNFGSLPTRIFEKTDAVSPLNDLFEKALEKGALDKFVDFFKALYPGR